ncbi:unnamed protein product [Cyclocybe aegerita]|uniref:Indoleamine 2,3-dioxygenase n=1 Tax=Cyclocybe aegerita TaxID=1973307 RepID=A0A8S0WJT5_CYCAE|nr:unnamed protein product [Cyclocybe aegerita]
MDHLGPNHFLSLPRPDSLSSTASNVPDTTTLAAHDFDVDTRTGFLPPQAPISRLPATLECWEVVLEDAIASKLQLGEKPDLSDGEKKKSEEWRERVRKLPILSIDELKNSEIALRRAHQVLGWIMHFYIHSMPPSEAICIPPPITLPLLQVSAQLQLPPVLTYSDDVLYNWRLDSENPEELPTIAALRRCQISFTSTTDEAEFYLVPARMELAGVEALELMRSTMDEMFVGDEIAVRRITGYLRELADVIQRLRELLLSVREGCDPHRFYNDIRPWFRGEDSQAGRKWVFEGIEQDPNLVAPKELSGASAGQSTLIHALDVFLGVNQTSKLLKRMQTYMPRHHRAFLAHLANNPRPLRDLVFTAATSDNGQTKDGAALLDAYNGAVMALKEFRDAHMIIVTLYVIGPARHAQKALQESGQPIPTASDYVQQAPNDDTIGKDQEGLKGTGGTDLVQFLKGVRDQTKEAVIKI